MKKKQMSVRLEEDLYHKIGNKTEDLGVSKSAFVSLASNFFLHQLEQAEKNAKGYSVNVYDILKHNLEQQYEKK